jgi:hypothetical protein
MRTKAVAAAALILVGAIGCVHHARNDTNAPEPTATSAPTATSVPTATSRPTATSVPTATPTTRASSAPDQQRKVIVRYKAHGTAKLDGQKLNITGGVCLLDQGRQLNIILWGPNPRQRVNASLYEPQSHQPVVRWATLWNNRITISYHQEQRILKTKTPPVAQATQDDSTYTITGAGWQAATPSLNRPFEITATCS